MSVKIKQSQIEPPMERSAMERHLELVKALSCAGFAWNPDDASWHRNSDGAAMTAESVEFMAADWPLLLPHFLKAIRGGARGFSMNVREQGDTVTVVLTVDTLLESMAKAASPQET